MVVRASDGSVGRDTITVHYQPGKIRYLDLEVSLERERNLKLEVERLEKSLSNRKGRRGLALQSNIVVIQDVNFYEPTLESKISPTLFLETLSV